MIRSIPVSIRPHVHGSLAGYLAKWKIGAKTVRYFVKSKDDANDTKVRAKEGKKPRRWAVRA